MRAAIMQPYFFPYIGYWQLFFNCDVWVFFDSVQYNKKSWMNRNRILHPEPEKEYQYINVPIAKHKKGALIRDVQINNDELWKKKINGQLTLYRRLRAPYYEEVTGLIENIICNHGVRFMPLITRMADMLASYLEMKTKCLVSSDLDLGEGVGREADDWALDISRIIGADSYINPYGGAEIFNVDKYRACGIDIKFLRPVLKPYSQLPGKFVPGLSIIDVLMFNSKDMVCDMLKNDFYVLDKNEAMKEVGR